MRNKSSNKCDNYIEDDKKEVDVVGIRRDIFYRQIGAKIAYYRTLYGMEQSQLAEKIHISQSTLSRIERGKYGENISIAMLLDIAEGLDIDPSLLTTFTGMEKDMWGYKSHFCE